MSLVVVRASETNALLASSFGYHQSIDRVLGDVITLPNPNKLPLIWH